MTPLEKLWLLRIRQGLEPTVVSANEKPKGEKKSGKEQTEETNNVNKD